MGKSVPQTFSAALTAAAKVTWLGPEAPKIGSGFRGLGFRVYQRPKLRTYYRHMILSCKLKLQGRGWGNSNRFLVSAEVY